VLVWLFHDGTNDLDVHSLQIGCSWVETDCLDIVLVLFNATTMFRKLVLLLFSGDKTKQGILLRCFTWCN
jgi:hypothetical protein